MEAPRTRTLTPHEMAVTLERGLRELGFFKQAGWELEPPDGEAEPDNFGISYRGDLLFTIQVQAW